MGGIQSYLWELWRRLPAGRAAVLTTPYAGDAEFDRGQPFAVERSRTPVLLPVPELLRTVRRAAREAGADFVVLDPALPLGLIGPRLGLPYAVVVHGAEISVPGRLPGGRAALAHVLRGASLVIAAGEFVLAEAVRAAGRDLPAVVVPPGVDVERFRPLGTAERAEARHAFGLPPSGPLVVAVTRLVPRKGIDVLVAAASLLAPSLPDLTVAVGGGGRDRDRLHRLVASTNAPVRLLGRVSDADLPRLVGCGDVFAMPCRNRWAGLEQEGFGIVFVEAAACGVPQVAGASGGAGEAVAHGVTGYVVRQPSDPVGVAGALDALVASESLRATMAQASRRRAVEQFSYDRLATRLDDALQAVR
ncbi:MAG: glycosyltransferase family 4 protein [Actinomycetota bacterium]